MMNATLLLEKKKRPLGFRVWCSRPERQTDDSESFRGFASLWKCPYVFFFAFIFTHMFLEREIFLSKAAASTTK